MKKQLGMLATVFMLATTMVMWSGCSGSRANRGCCPEPCPESCPQQEVTCCPEVQPACCEEPCCKVLPKCCYPSSNTLRCEDGLIVRVSQPERCLLANQYPITVCVEACKDVCDAVVMVELPSGVSYISSNPQGELHDKQLKWNLGRMKCGECKQIEIMIKCECEGEVCVCFCATAIPVRFCSALCAKPILTCQKCGPEEVCPGDTVRYQVTITNRGSAAAEDVVITDHVPEQLEHASGQRSIVTKIGCLRPCESKTVNFCFTACKRGRACNTAVVTACNADTVSCQACTNITICCCETTKTGPKEVMMGKNADYQITVKNTGDKKLTDVVITDCAPSSTSIVSANGAKLNGNQAVWRLKEIKPGEKVNFNLTLTSCTPGCYTNRISVDNCQHCCCSAQATTRWKGRPALDMCVVDTEDMICVGDETTYKVTVQNRGTEPDSNVTVVLRFPDEIAPQSATGPSDGQVSGQIVKFEPLKYLNPRQTVEYRVIGKAKRSGDARVMIELSSDNTKPPLTQQHSTIVN